MPDIQQFSVDIKFKTEGAEGAEAKIKSLEKQLDKLQNSSSKGSMVMSALGKIGSASGKALIGLGVGAIAAVKGTVKLSQSIMKLTQKESDYIETVNLFRASMSSSADVATQFIDKAESLLGLDPSKMMDAISSFQNLSEGFGIASDKAYLMSQNLTQLSGDLSSFANISFETAQKKLMSGFSGQVLPLRKYGIALDQVSLQELAYSLGIDKKVKSMTRAQKTELIYYQIMKSTQKIQGDLSRSLLSPANSMRVLQTEFTKLARAVGSIFIPGLMRIIPVVRAVTQVLTSAATAIAKFFGFDVGDYYADLSDLGNLLNGVSDGVGDIGDEAEGTAKKLNKMLMPFDELNNITSSAGAGAGGGAGLEDGGSLGIELPTYDMFGDVEKQFNEFLNSNNWYIIGEKFANKINETLRSIDWATIQEEISKATIKVTDLINGAIENINWELVGNSIGKGINTLLTMAYDFLTRFNFSAAGEALGNLIEGAIDSIQWDKLGQAVSKGIEGILDFVEGFIRKLSINDIVEAITQLLSNINWKNIFLKVAILISKATIEALEWAIKSVFGPVYNSIYNLAKQFNIDMPTLNELIDFSGTQELLDDYYDSLSTAQQKTQEVYNEMEKDVTKFTTVGAQRFEDLADKTFSVGKETVGNYNNGLNSEKGNTETILNGVSNIVMQDLNQEYNAKVWGSSTMGAYNTTIKTQGMETRDMLNKLRTDMSTALNNSGGAKTGATDTMQTYSNTIETKSSGTMSALDRLRTDMNNALNNRSGAQSGGSNTIGGYNEGIESQKDNTRYATSLITDILSGKLNTPSEARKWGSDMIDGLIKGIQDKSPAAKAAITSVANVISRVLHFSRPDEGPLREYEQWMPDMMSGLSRTLIGSIPKLNSALYQVAETIAESIQEINLPNVDTTLYSNINSSQIVGQIGSRVASSNKGIVDMAQATYDAINRAFEENKTKDSQQIIQVNIGNKKIYEGYGQYKEEQANMLGVNL